MIVYKLRQICIYSYILLQKKKNAIWKTIFHSPSNVLVNIIKILRVFFLLQTSPDGNTTTSVLTFTPTVDDGGKYLSCRGQIQMIPDSGKEDGWKLDIHRKFAVPLIMLLNYYSV